MIPPWGLLTKRLSKARRKTLRLCAPHSGIWRWWECWSCFTFAVYDHCAAECPHASLVVVVVVRGLTVPRSGGFFLDFFVFVFGFSRFSLAFPASLSYPRARWVFAFSGSSSIRLSEPLIPARSFVSARSWSPSHHHDEQRLCYVIHSTPKKLPDIPLYTWYLKQLNNRGGKISKKPDQRSSRKSEKQAPFLAFMLWRSLRSQR